MFYKSCHFKCFVHTNGPRRPQNRFKISNAKFYQLSIHRSRVEQFLSLNTTLQEFVDSSWRRKQIYSRKKYTNRAIIATSHVFNFEQKRPCSIFVLSDIRLSILQENITKANGILFTAISPLLSKEYPIPVFYPRDLL